jgi:hypothetical protein
MENPGSDAGVFVCADSTDVRYCAANADAHCDAALEKSATLR